MRQNGAPSTERVLDGGDGKADLRRPRLAFVYSARDTLWPRIGRVLFAQGGAIHDVLAPCERYIDRRLGWSLAAVSAGDEPKAEHMLEPVLTACQMALTAAWGERGVEPDALVARCGGEFAAAYAQGALTLEQAIEMACRVSVSIREGRGAGRMLALRCTSAQAERLQQSSNPPFWFVGEEQLDLTIISCASEDASAIGAFLDANGIENWPVPVAIAPHCPIVEEWRTEMSKPLSGPSMPGRGLPYYSAAVAAGSTGENLDVGHFWRVVREPALIRRALDLAIADGCRIFVEVGGHPTLAPLLRERGEMAGAEVIALPTMRREEPVPAVMDETAAALRHPFTGSTRGDLSEVWST